MKINPNCCETGISISSRLALKSGRAEWDDFQEILRYLHRHKQTTFFTRDFDFFQPQLRHANYSLVVIAAPMKETATFIKLFMRHAGFNTRAKRCGKVIRLSARVISWWEIGTEVQQDLLC